MKVRFKISKTLTEKEEHDMHGFVSSLEQAYAAELNRDERMLYTLFDFTTSWNTYQAAIHFIRQIAKGRPYLTVL